MFAERCRHAQKPADEGYGPVKTAGTDNCLELKGGKYNH